MIRTLAALAVMATPSFAQIPCAMRDDILKIITGKFQESLIATFGVHGDFVEMYSSPEGATVTIIATQSNGLTCIIAAGKNLKSFKLPLSGRDL